MALFVILYSILTISGNFFMLLIISLTAYTRKEKEGAALHMLAICHPCCPVLVWNYFSQAAQQGFVQSVQAGALPWEGWADIDWLVTEHGENDIQKMPQDTWKILCLWASLPYLYVHLKQLFVGCLWILLGSLSTEFISRYLFIFLEKIELLCGNQLILSGDLGFLPCSWYSHGLEKCLFHLLQVPAPSSCGGKTVEVALSQTTW